MKKRCVLITGIGGQDGVYLTSLLLKNDIKIIGLSRNEIPYIKKYLYKYIQWDFSSIELINKILKEDNIDAIYNFAARASSAQLYDNPKETNQVNATAVLLMLESIRKISPNTKFIQSGSSEMYRGLGVGALINEQSLHAPVSFYGASKSYAHKLVDIYTHNYGLNGYNVILFNHESPLRGDEFVSQKIASEAARNSRGVRLRNIYAMKDWSHASDFVESIYKISKQEYQKNFIICSGIQKSVMDICKTAYESVGLNWHEYIDVPEAGVLKCDGVIGDNELIIKQNLWNPKYSFEELIYEMVTANLKKYSKEEMIKKIIEEGGVNV